MHASLRHTLPFPGFPLDFVFALVLICIDRYYFISVSRPGNLGNSSPADPAPYKQAVTLSPL